MQTHFVLWEKNMYLRNVNDVHLTDEEVDALLEPLGDHGHCRGEIIRQMITGEKERRYQNYLKKQDCEKSPTKKHKWEYEYDWARISGAPCRVYCIYCDKRKWI